MSQEQDQRFFRNYALVIGILAVMVLIFFTLAQIIGEDEEANVQQRAAVVAERTAPVGKVNISGQTESSSESSGAAVTAAASTEDPGKRVFNSLCFTCHGNEQGVGGIPGSPHFGDKDAWAGRIAQGEALLYEHAIKGFTGESGVAMPPKGGNPNLTDDEIKAAVDFMVENSQ